jgi:thiol-disulfide isomerase/thioredoxin
MKLFVKLTIFVLFVISSCNEVPRNRFAKNILPQRNTADVKLAEPDGSPIDLTRYHGKAIFINFWATWCKPCLREMPSLQQLIQQLEGEDIVFLFASDEEGSVIEEFKNRNSYPFTYVQVQNIEQLNIYAIPTTYIFNQEGHLVFSHTGARRWDHPAVIDTIRKILHPR